MRTFSLFTCFGLGTGTPAPDPTPTVVVATRGSSTRVRELVDNARLRHWSFIDVQLADGAAVLWLNQRQRHLLLKFRDALRGLIGSNVETASIVSGSLVGVTADGTPYFLTTVDDGFSLNLSAGGTPYVDTTKAPVARDPFGQNGGTPGWPLPNDAIALLAMTAMFNNGSESPVTIVDESERLVAAPGRYLPAFVAGNRIVPIRPSSTFGLSDSWSSVTSVRLSYIGVATITSLDGTLVIPAPLHEPLIAGLAELFAKQSRQCTVGERAQFGEAARRAELEIAQGAFDVLGDMQTTSVIYEE